MSTGITDAPHADPHYVRERVRVKRKWRQRRRRLLILLGILVMIAIVVVLTLIPAFSGRDSLLEARAYARDARAALSAGDIAAAGKAFEASAVSFIQATEQARNPMLRLAGLIPFVGRTPDALLAISESGGEVAQAGVGLA